MYLNWENYRAALRTLDFSDEDFADGGSDRLVDSIVVQGDEHAVSKRVEAYLDAGADHVCVQPLPALGGQFPVEELRRLAEALADLTRK